MLICDANGSVLDDANLLHGAPTAIQVVTRRFRDEECLAAAQVIDRVLNGSGG